MNAIDKIKHKGYTIHVHRDDDAEAPENCEDDLFLVTTQNRYFTPKHPEGFNLEGCKDDEYSETHDVFPLYAYIHSGVALSLGRTGQFADRWDSGLIGYVLVSKTGGFTDAWETAKAYVEEWNQYLSGEVYGYTVTDPEGEDTGMSCWGFYGDYSGYMLTEAKGEIDATITYLAEENRKTDAMMHL